MSCERQLTCDHETIDDEGYCQECAAWLHPRNSLPRILRDVADEVERDGFNPAALDRIQRLHAAADETAATVGFDN